MTIDDDADLTAIDDGLARMFAGDQPVPSDFTLRVLRRVQEQRWRREVFLGRVFHAGLCASGSLIIAGVGVALGTLAPLSNDAAVKIVAAGLAISVAATWPALRRGTTSLLSL